MPPFTVPTAESLRALASRRLDEIVFGEIERARPRLKQLRRRYPDASPRVITEQLIEHKKAYAGTGGMVTGLFGLVAVPADLLLVTYLQISLIVEIGLLHQVNLKSRQGQQEVLEVLARGNGVTGPIARAGSPILARLTLLLIRKRGIPLLGRAVPLVSAPVAAWLNNRDIQRVGEEALRHFGTLRSLPHRAAPEDHTG